MQHLSKDEIKKLLREIENPKQKLMVLVSYLHGLRVSELVSLTGLSIRDGYVNVQRLKGSKRTIQPYVYAIDKDLSEGEGLSALAATLKPTERVFPMTRFGVFKLIKRAGTRAGLPQHKLHPHALKHSIAYELVDKMPINLVQKHLGHASLSSTGRYTEAPQEVVSRAVAGVFA